MSKTANVEDVVLLKQIHQGDEQSLGRLMVKHYPNLLNYGSNFTGNKELIKDCVQEIFIGLWQKKETATEILSPKFYFLRALKNKILKELNKTSRLDAYTGESDNYPFIFEIPSSYDTSEMQFTTEKIDMLNTVLKTLSSRQREVFYLKFVQYLDNEQISNILNLNRQSVYNLMHQIINRLRIAIKPFLMTQ